MVDNINPNSQFHPYQPMNETPVSERPASGLNGMMDSMKNFDMKGSVDKFRGLAQKNPGAVLGGLAALAIGMGLMRGRR